MPDLKILKNIAFHLLLRKNKESVFPANYNYSKASRIALIFESIRGEENSYIQDFCSLLLKDNKKLVLIKYVIEPEKEVHHKQNRKDISYFVISKKETNIFSLIKKKYYQKIIAEDFDIIINLSQSTRITLHYLAALCRAKLKIAPYNRTYAGIYEFMIQLEDNADQKTIIDQIGSYLFRINTNRNEI
jgi:hypothetical protein